jgi:hypothetical protein
MLRLDLFNKALLWTAVAGLIFVVWVQARPRSHKYDTMLRAAEGHWMLSQVATALLAAGLAVASLYLFFLPTLLAQNVAAPVATDAVAAYALPDGGAMVVQVQGMPAQRPANGHGTWRVGDYTFSANAKTTIRGAPGQPVAACLVQQQDGQWQATFIAPVSDAPSC